MSPATHFPSLVSLVRCKVQVRRRIGFFDWHPCSHDMHESKARAWRLWNRIHGVRLTMNQARWS